MTTAEPLIDEPTVPVADLEPMMADRERLCEIPQPAGQHVEDCNRPAMWALTGICDEGAKQRLACDDDTSALVAFGAHCLRCGGHVSISHAERL